MSTTVVQALELSGQEAGWLAQHSNTVRVAYHGNFIPLEFTDADGKAAGIAPDFLRWIADRGGFNIEFSAALTDQARSGLESGRFDLISSIFFHETLTNTFHFSSPFLEMPLSVFVPVSSPVRSLEDLQGAVVAGEGYYQQKLIHEKVGAEFQSCQALDYVVRAVESGRADALICFEPVLEYYLKTTSVGITFRSVGEPLDIQPCCIGSQVDSPLNGIIDKIVDEAVNAGVSRWITRTWVGSPHLPFSMAFSRYLRYIVIGVGLLLGAVLLFWVWDIRLSRRVHEKTTQLRNSEERLRTIFQNSPDAIFIEDEDGIVLDANPIACRFHNMTRSELIGTNVLSLVPPARRDQIRQDFRKWFTGEMRRYEGFSLNGDGKEVPVEVIGSPLRFEGQSAVLLLMRDMTERKRAEQALKESEMRYRGLIEAQSNFIVRIDTDNHFTFINEAFCRFIGRARGELLGQDFHTYIHHEDFSIAEKAVETLIARRERVVVVEHRMRAKMHTAWVRWENIAVFDEEGRVTEIQCVGQDITERRRMNEALKESEKRLLFLFEEIPHIAVQGYNASREAIFWNHASEVLYGYEKKEALGRRIEDLVIPENLRDEMVAAFTDWVKTGRPIPSGEMIKRNCDEQPVPVYSSRLATRNRRGEWEMYVIDVDLSELKRASEELVKAKDAAERANRAKSEFLANMSHEIRTPMNGVMGMTNLLLESDLTDDQRDSVQTIMESTQELLHIIDELLDISRIEAGELRLHPEPFSPRETAEKVVLLFAERAGAKGVDLSVAIHDSVPRQMVGDAGRIRQILINLVGNALKFTHDGHIQIRMQAESHPGGWDLVADVKDTGIGIPLELQKNVFEKFTQGDASSKREYGGTGLGLAITRQLVELMGGKISVDSEVGKGTTFSFNLLLGRTEEDVAAPNQTDSNKPPEIHGEVLLVEDNLVNQKVATAMLKKYGCFVTIAPNGARALEQLASKQFDLIFMDCQMPVMDGFEATKAIRQMVGDVSGTPIVAMTAHALKEDRQRCLDVGMDDYLSKPVNRDKLLEVLHKYCG